MEKVVVNVQQLEDAFKSHLKLWEAGSKNPKRSMSEKLILFYAAEVGLKRKFLLKHNLRDTKGFEKVLGNPHGYGHRISKWAEELKIPATKLGYFSDSPSDPIEKAHEKLRYGGTIKDEQLVYLISVVSFLKNN